MVVICSVEVGNEFRLCSIRNYQPRLYAFEKTAVAADTGCHDQATLETVEQTETNG